MSEKECWLFLAELWDKPVVIDEIPYINLGFSVCGLCHAICQCWHMRKIKADVCTKMLDAIRASPKYNVNNLIWPLTEEGAKCRAAFCREQASKL